MVECLYNMNKTLDIIVISGVGNDAAGGGPSASGSVHGNQSSDGAPPTVKVHDSN
jgi:hypothetical protein